MKAAGSKSGKYTPSQDRVLVSEIFFSTNMCVGSNTYQTWSCHGNITFNVSLWIEALKDLKVKQEELSKNERMTRKKMVADMRALQVERVDTMYAYEHNYIIVTGGYSKGK